tara:strand:+ start:1485 stop:1931 length:447 start_codon:yes stop_codon:yes gene_type:complete
MEYFRKNPDASASVVTRKFNMAISTVYQLRAKVRAEAKGLPELPELELEPMFGTDMGPNSVDAILDSRAKDYGKFIDGAEIMQMIKRIVHTYIERRDTQLAFDQREALDMIVHKMGRIINGNPDKVDSWRDVAGYATLVADRLEGNAR